MRQRIWQFLLPIITWLHSRDVPAPDNKSLGYCCRNSRPTVINPLIYHDVSSDRAWWLPHREPCVSCQSPASTKSLGARRQYSQATVNNVLPVMTGSPALLTWPPPGTDAKSAWAAPRVNPAHYAVGDNESSTKITSILVTKYLFPGAFLVLLDLSSHVWQVERLKPLAMASLTGNSGRNYVWNFSFTFQ